VERQQQAITQTGLVGKSLYHTKRACRKACTTPNVGPSYANRACRKMPVPHQTWVSWQVERIADERGVAHKFNFQLQGDLGDKPAQASKMIGVWLCLQPSIVLILPSVHGWRRGCSLLCNFVLIESCIAMILSSKHLRRAMLQFEMRGLCS